MALDESDYKIIKEIRNGLNEQNNLIETQNRILSDLVEQLKYLR